jgi:late competence protein required for DNA uptake (superfamily II DNA/RNA helicase)
VLAVELVILSSTVMKGKKDVSVNTSSKDPMQKIKVMKMAKPALPLMITVRIIEVGITVAAFSISSARIV